jgi:membrane-associated protein
VSASANEAGASFWRRHTVLLVLIGCGLLLCVIVLGQLLDQGDVKEWLSEQSPGWAYLSIFGLVALDAVVPIFPGETTLSAASTIAADGGLQLELVMLAGALGAIVGDSSLFWIARKSSARVKPRLDKAFKNEKIAVAWDMLQSSPGLLIVAGRYVPGMRFAVNASMGVSVMPYRRFLPWSILGGALWSVYTCALAYNVATTLAGYPLASLVISGLVTSAMLAVILYVYRRKQKRGEETGAPDAEPGGVPPETSPRA